MASLFVGHAAQKSKLHNLQYDEGGNHMAETYIIGITSNTCKLRLFQGNSFLNIVYFYKKNWRQMLLYYKKKIKNTRVSVLKIYEYSIFQTLNENINRYKIIKIN